MTPAREVLPAELRSRFAGERPSRRVGIQPSRKRGHDVFSGECFAGTKRISPLRGAVDFFRVRRYPPTFDAREPDALRHYSGLRVDDAEPVAILHQLPESAAPVA